MRGVVVVLTLCVFAFAPGPAGAAAGDLDPSFGTAGIASDPYTGQTSAGLALQANGKILVAELDAGGLELVRYDTNGVLDPTFGVGGIVTQPAPGGGILVELVVLPSGQLLLLAGGGSTFVLARYDATGTPDPAFGVGGIVALPDCAAEYGSADLAVQPDGKLVIGMMAVVASSGEGQACVMRVDASGVPDPGFGIDGVVVLSDWFVDAIAIQGDGVLVGGVVVNGSTGAAAVTRLKSNGAIDGGFGSGGVFTAASPVSGVTGLAVRANGILAVSPQAEVLCLHSNGDPDVSFGSGGIATIYGDEFLGGSSALGLQADGGIVVATTVGESHAPIGFIGNVQLNRLHADGTLDASFGGGSPIDTVSGFLSGLVLQPDGKILVSGVVVPNPISPVGRVGVARHIGLTPPCPASPASGCRASVVPFGGKLRMDSATDLKAKMQWSWQKGAATALGDFGDPVGGDDYALCVYDESGSPMLATGARLPGGGTCRGKPCWKALGTSGFAYKDPARVRFGIAAVKLKAGGDGKAQIKIQGQGTTLPVPALPAPLPLRVQLIAENGQCWESVFSSTLTRNDGERLQGKSD